MIKSHTKRRTVDVDGDIIYIHKIKGNCRVCGAPIEKICYSSRGRLVQITPIDVCANCDDHVEALLRAHGREMTKQALEGYEKDKYDY